MKRHALKPLALFLLLTALAAAQDVASFEKRITVKRLENGLTVVICERPEAPVFSFFTHVDAGSAQDPIRPDRAGPHVRAHGLQGHRDQNRHQELPAEKPPSEGGAAYAAYIAERDKRSSRDEAKLKQLEKAWQDAVEDADST
jgi:hypothetical protein